MTSFSEFRRNGVPRNDKRALKAPLERRGEKRGDSIRTRPPQTHRPRGRPSRTSLRGQGPQPSCARKRRRSQSGALCQGPSYCKRSTDPLHPKSRHAGDVPGLVETAGGQSGGVVFFKVVSSSTVAPRSAGVVKPKTACWGAVSHPLTRLHPAHPDPDGRRPSESLLHPIASHWQSIDSPCLSFLFQRFT